MLDDIKSYGEVFKEMRVNKGISKKEACAGVCSELTLCHFESGKNNLSLRKFFRLLKNIDVLGKKYFDAFNSYRDKVKTNADDNKFPLDYHSSLIKKWPQVKKWPQESCKC
ncbi:MAG: helix-turn-helix domain-containing protein [Streptococcaceae bacterium]|jgi:transcriptional regulator with XRE-family HTH domain|nr:helix-turn-helix domain-containing protein [Streptococcaceae bacterium]